ncbi:MAG: HAD-IA family hydrolase [Actinomycetota bacterium]|nr:HAD-IA family hydrolase [Actinomycetota bacterium]
MDLTAVIFDVDGTLAQTERHGHRVAFNKAFEELGLPDRWDEQLYGELLRVTGGVRRLVHYFTNYQGMEEEKAQHLAEQIHPLKTQLFLELVDGGEVPPRPGALRLLKQLGEEGIRLGVATTGTRGWVLPLMDQLTKMGQLHGFETTITGDDVTNRKPDPEAFVLALERLGAQARDALIVEDSKNGVAAAKGASCCCLAVRGEYAKAADLSNADLVVDEFGEPDSPLQVLDNPFGVEVGPMLTPAVLKDLHARWLRKQAAGTDL